jgi:hypothetical protein
MLPTLREHDNERAAKNRRRRKRPFVLFYGEGMVTDTSLE